MLFTRLAAQEGSLQWALTLQGWSVSSPAVSPDGATIYVGVETRTARGLLPEKVAHADASASSPG